MPLGKAVCRLIIFSGRGSSRPPAASTKCPSTACILPPNQPPTENNAGAAECCRRGSPSLHSSGWSARRAQIRRQSLPPVDHLAGNDGGHGCAPEGATVERRVTALAGRFLDLVRPRVVGRENGQVGGMA